MDDAEDRLEELRSAVLRDWVVVTARTSAEIADMQSTVSWRITRPLRMVRSVQRAGVDGGFRGASELIAHRVAQRLAR